MPAPGRASTPLPPANGVRAGRPPPRTGRAALERRIWGQPLERTAGHPAHCRDRARMADPEPPGEQVAAHRSALVAAGAGCGAARAIPGGQSLSAEALDRTRAGCRVSDGRRRHVRPGRADRRWQGVLALRDCSCRLVVDPKHDDARVRPGRVRGRMSPNPRSRVKIIRSSEYRGTEDGRVSRAHEALGDRFHVVATFGETDGQRDRQLLVELDPHPAPPRGNQLLAGERCSVGRGCTQPCNRHGRILSDDLVLRHASGQAVEDHGPCPVPPRWTGQHGTISNSTTRTLGGCTLRQFKNHGSRAGRDCTGGRAWVIPGPLSIRCLSPTAV